MTLDWRTIQPSRRGVRVGAHGHAARRAPYRGDPARDRDLGHPAWANGGRGPNVAPRSAATFATFARAAARAVPLGEAMGRLERAEPASLARSSVSDRVRDEAPQPGGGGDQVRHSRRARSPAARLPRVEVAAAPRRSTSSARWAGRERRSTRTHTIRTRCRQPRRPPPAAARAARRSRWRRSSGYSTRRARRSARGLASGSPSSATRRTHPIASWVSAGRAQARFNRRGAVPRVRRKPGRPPDPVPRTRRADVPRPGRAVWRRRPGARSRRSQDSRCPSRRSRGAASRPRCGARSAWARVHAATSSSGRSGRLAVVPHGRDDCVEGTSRRRSGARSARGSGSTIPATRKASSALVVR